MSKQVRSGEEKHNDVPRRRRRRRYQKAVIDYDEMSVRYGAIKLKVPDGFKQLLENLSREILREQPKNISRFSAAYFNRLLERREQGYDDLGLVTERIVETDASPSATEEVLQPTVVAAEKAAPAVVVEAATVPAEAPAEDDSAAKPATEPGPIEPEPAAEEEMPDLDDPAVGKAATLIQASFRGFKKRKSLTPDAEPIEQGVRRIQDVTNASEISKKDVDEGDPSTKESIIDAMFEAGQDDEAVKVESDMQNKIDELEKHVISDDREAKDVEEKLPEPKQFSDESQVEEFKASEVECFEPVISKDVKATDAAPSEILAASTHNEESEKYDFVHEDTTDKIPTVQLNFKEIKALESTDPEMAMMNVEEKTDEDSAEKLATEEEAAPEPSVPAEEPAAEPTQMEVPEAKIAVEETAPIAEAAPAAEAEPATDAAPAAETEPVTDTAPIEETIPVAESAPAVEVTPATETMPAEEVTSVAEAAPAEETTPATEAAPAEETNPATEAAPVVESAPATEAAPVEETIPATEAAPVEETIPATEAAPVEETIPATEAAPVVETAPAEETSPSKEAVPADEAAPASTVVAPAEEAAPAAAEDAPVADTAPAEETSPSKAAPADESVPAPAKEAAPGAEDTPATAEDTAAAKESESKVEEPTNVAVEAAPAAEVAADVDTTPVEAPAAAEPGENPSAE